MLGPDLRKGPPLTIREALTFDDVSAGSRRFHRAAGQVDTRTRLTKTIELVSR